MVIIVVAVLASLEMSLAAHAACLLIRGYQLTFGRLIGVFGDVCRFEPTCSHYALEAIRRHGFVGGHDPVP